MKITKNLLTASGLLGLLFFFIMFSFLIIMRVATTYAADNFNYLLPNNNILSLYTPTIPILSSSQNQTTANQTDDWLYGKEVDNNKVPTITATIPSTSNSTISVFNKINTPLLSFSLPSLATSTSFNNILKDSNTVALKNLFNNNLASSSIFSQLSYQPLNFTNIKPQFNSQIGSSISYTPVSITGRTPVNKSFSSKVDDWEYVAGENKNSLLSTLPSSAPPTTSIPIMQSQPYGYSYVGSYSMPSATGYGTSAALGSSFIPESSLAIGYSGYGGASFNAAPTAGMSLMSYSSVSPQSYASSYSSKMSYGSPYTSMSASDSSSYDTSSSIGFSTGGAKDINNFRENIKNDYLPIVTDITYEGLFYDYYFDTGEKETCENLFCPSYSLAVTKDPFSGKSEYYMAVGLNSGLKESDFQRKKLNLVIVLDISGSMGSQFNRYYYDRYGNTQSIIGTGDTGKSKMEIATEAIVGLIDHLEAHDRFGMVLFESEAHLAKPLRLVGETDMVAIKGHILDLTEKGGTQMSAGMGMATEMLEAYVNVNQTEYENRIIFLTDAMPNIGDTSKTGLLGMLKNNVNDHIYTTFIGIGVDFNTELVEYITKIRGANYYSVHSSAEFIERMGVGFDYMVTPLVFNLKLEVETSGYEIEKVYGSPEANEATGEIMKVNTLFPSLKAGGETKGGIVLLKLKKKQGTTNIKLSASYENREGIPDSTVDNIDFSMLDAEYFENNGLRKAVLLSRYGDLIKDWIIDERRSLKYNDPIYYPLVDYEEGISVPPTYTNLGQWERQSADLQVSEIYRGLFNEFRNYFNSEMNIINDNTLDQEADILDILRTYSD